MVSTSMEATAAKVKRSKRNNIKGFSTFLIVLVEQREKKKRDSRVGIPLFLYLPFENRIYLGNFS